MPVIVIDDTPLPVPSIPPPALPSPGPIIQYLGEGEHAIWDNVWGWVSGTAKKVAGLEAAGISVIAAQVLPIVEAYVGQLLKATSGFLNDIADFASMGIDVAIDYADAGLRQLLNDVLGIEDWISNLEGLLADVASVAIPALLAEIIRIGGSIEPLILDGLANVETWAIDNIYDPLTEDIIRTAGDIYTDIQAVADWVVAEAEGLVSAETLARIAAIAGLAATVASILTWIEECGAPMCDTLGPKTDLGKFLKGLSIAETAILLAELANLDGNGVENLLRGLVRVSGGVIDDIDLIFSGGETLGGAITRAL